VASTLWKQPTAGRSLEHNKISETDPVSALRQLDSLALPIGWSNYAQPPKGAEQSPAAPSWSDAPEMILGWLITAVAALFGAPFWFDLLQRVIRLKGAGPSPEEKQADTAAAA
jgi:hypothetical protein